jgi:hypothetical protein
LHAYVVADGHVGSTGYYYDIELGDEGIQFHWHPRVGVRYPHVNIRPSGSAAHLVDRHIPTGRTSIESVIRFLITELGAVPIRQNWREILDRNEAEFMRRSSWQLIPPDQSGG